MSLAERVKAATGDDREAAAESKKESGLRELRRRLHAKVVEGLGSALFEGQVTDAELKPRVMEMLEWALDQDRAIPLSKTDRLVLIEDVANDVLGYGPIDPYLTDPAITEIMVNGPYSVWVERHGRLIETETRFVDATHLRRIIDKIVSEVGRRIDEATPMVDARLPDGSRVNAVIHPLAIGGPVLTIRKFAVDPFTVGDLVANRTMSEQVAGLLSLTVQGRLNIIVSGATGSGKTTLLNVLSNFIPDGERIVTVEDAAELQLNQRHVVTLESRPPNIEGVGQVAVDVEIEEEEACTQERS